ncbi:LysR family transcriptional regulator [Candidimonas sp. SYP-B2681]|uniref:LysR substrate-binding domain-containing protein n=1 Tax=Candidimonas sp. SYP-B2681 TaxID=2497686 RepID=UPI000F8761A3|nr:LysR substrate-binding domain-containing protein [Candidimonas sp. SYP-B2681]RTZ43411.1 LysR family transcriptional regulator [Candidimonas sp. SYP-B2681]
MFLRKLTPSMSQLLAFEAAARHGNFTKAANELCLTQSAVSRHIQALEAMLRVVLFERTGRQIKLTAEGQRYAQEVGAALNRIRNASMHAYESGANANALQLAVLPIFGSKWLMPRLSRFYDRHPDLLVNIHSRIGEFDLALSGMDAYITLGDGHWPTLAKDHLVDARAVVIASPSLLKQKPIHKAADLMQHQLLHVTSHSPGWKECLLASRIDPRTVVLGAQFEYTAHLIQAVISGMGVGLVSDVFVREECQQGSLVVPDIPDFAVRNKSYYLVYAPDNGANPSLCLFRDWLLEEVS